MGRVCLRIMTAERKSRSERWRYINFLFPLLSIWNLPFQKVQSFKLHELTCYLFKDSLNWVFVNGNQRGSG